MKIPVIVGPTSSGKTGLSLKLAKMLQGEILSADSRQIYKFMDVGTGKIPLGKDVAYEKQLGFWLMDGVKIWGYDLVTPDVRFSAYDFAREGLTYANNLLKQGKVPILAGGTGLYIDFFTGRYKDLKGPPDLQLRKKLESKSLKELQDEVTSLNPDINYSDFHNPVRLVRIIERNKTSKTQSPLPYPTSVEYVYIGLKTSREILYARTDSWVDSIWQDDLILKEVRKLWELGYKDSSRLSGIVYKNAVFYLKNKKSRAEAVERTKFNLHAYVRRQLTYFRRNSQIKWFDIRQDNLAQNVYNYIKGRTYE